MSYSFLLRFLVVCCRVIRGVVVLKRRFLGIVILDGV